HGPTRHSNQYMTTAATHHAFACLEAPTQPGCHSPHLAPGRRGENLRAIAKTSDFIHDAPFQLVLLGRQMRISREAEENPAIEIHFASLSVRTILRVWRSINGECYRTCLAHATRYWFWSRISLIVLQIERLLPHPNDPRDPLHIRGCHRAIAD